MSERYSHLERRIAGEQQTFARPLRSLSMAMRRVRQGHLVLPELPPANDEVGTLIEREPLHELALRSRLYPVVRLVVRTICARCETPAHVVHQVVNDRGVREGLADFHLVGVGEDHRPGRAQAVANLRRYAADFQLLSEKR